MLTRLISTYIYIYTYECYNIDDIYGLVLIGTRALWGHQPSDEKAVVLGFILVAGLCSSIILWSLFKRIFQRTWWRYDYVSYRRWHNHLVHRRKLHLIHTHRASIYLKRRHRHTLEPLAIQRYVLLDSSDILIHNFSIYLLDDSNFKKFCITCTSNGLYKIWPVCSTCATASEDTWS